MGLLAAAAVAAAGGGATIDPGNIAKLSAPGVVGFSEADPVTCALPGVVAPGWATIVTLAAAVGWASAMLTGTGVGPADRDEGTASAGSVAARRAGRPATAGAVGAALDGATARPSAEGKSNPCADGAALFVAGRIAPTAVGRADAAVACPAKTGCVAKSACFRPAASTGAACIDAEGAVPDGAVSGATVTDASVADGVAPD